MYSRILKLKIQKKMSQLLIKILKFVCFVNTILTQMKLFMKLLSKTIQISIISHPNRIHLMKNLKNLGPASKFLIL